MDFIKVLSLKNLEILLSELRKIFSPLYHTHSKADITDLADPEVNEFLQIVYPIGAIYISVNPANPSTLFGGTWQQIKDRFLLSAGDKYNGGDTGGEVSHKLTVSELPSHTHTASVSSNGSHNHKIGTDKDAVYTTSGNCWSVHNSSSGASYINGYTNFSGDHTHTVTLSNTGNNSAHNNMPPYVAVYMWERIA